MAFERKHIILVFFLTEFVINVVDCDLKDLEDGTIEVERLRDIQDYINNEKSTFEPPVGHLQPLGSHRPPEGQVEVLSEFPHPESFFEEYVFESRPVIFKGAAKKMPAYSKWTDDYLLEKFGQVVLDVETGKKENRDGKSLQMPFMQFLQTYKTEDIYAVHNVAAPLTDDLSLPPSLACGGLQGGLDLGVLWFSSGSTKSVLHYDDMDNINCLLDGHKSVIFIDREFAPEVEEAGFQYRGSFSRVDVDAVDFYQFPSLAEVSWWKADIEKGDCFYIPYRWYHYVHSAPGRNLAVNSFFVHRMWVDDLDCHGYKHEQWSQTYPSLTNYPLNAQTGGGSLEKVRCDMFEQFDGLSEISMDDALEVWDGLIDAADIQDIFEVIDSNKDLLLSWEEVYLTDVLELVRDFPFLLAAEEDDDKEERWDDVDDWEEDGWGERRSHEYIHESEAGEAWDNMHNEL